MLQYYYMKSQKSKVNIDDVIAACERDDNSGFCTACGAQADGVEPDARKYKCESCGANAVYGAEELLLMMAWTPCVSPWCSRAYEDCRPKSLIVNTLQEIKKLKIIVDRCFDSDILIPMNTKEMSATQAQVVAALEKRRFYTSLVSDFPDDPYPTIFMTRRAKSYSSQYAEVDSDGSVNGMTLEKYLQVIA